VQYTRLVWRRLQPRRVRARARGDRRSRPGSGPGRRSAGATLRAVEGDAAIAQRDPGVVADHEMVEQVDVEQAAGGEGLGGQVEVVR
jgi:hypothetical protein